MYLLSSVAGLSCVFLWNWNINHIRLSFVFIPAYTQIQTHQLLQQHKQQFMIQQQPQILQRGQAQLLEATSIHPHTVQAVAIQPALPAQPQQCLSLCCPKCLLPANKLPSFHLSTAVSQQVLAQNGQPPMLSHSKAAPLQLTAVNVQIQASSKLK